MTYVFLNLEFDRVGPMKIKLPGRIIIRSPFQYKKCFNYKNKS